MENFVSEDAKKVWDIFTKTGSISAYLLYSAIQHGKYQDLVIDDTQEKDGGMEL